jgi:hypothetical protein
MSVPRMDWALNTPSRAFNDLSQTESFTNGQLFTDRRAALRLTLSLVLTFSLRLLFFIVIWHDLRSQSSFMTRLVFNDRDRIEYRIKDKNVNYR